MAAPSRPTSTPTQETERGAPAVLPGVEFHSFLDSLGVAVYTTDAAGGINYFNDAAVALWGRGADLGQPWSGSWRLYWPDGRPMPLDDSPMAIALRQDQPIRGVEVELERPDGTRAVFMSGRSTCWSM
jgi:PAS domain-containing protein